MDLLDSLSDDELVSHFDYEILLAAKESETGDIHYYGAVPSGPILKIGGKLFNSSDKRIRTAIITSFNNMRGKNWIYPLTQKQYRLSAEGLETIHNWSAERVPPLNAIASSRRSANRIMAIEESDVETAITRILEAAREAEWKLQLYGKTFDSVGSVATLAGHLGTTEEESIILLEAFDRMLHEYRWLRHDSGIWYKVTTAGMKALDALSSGKTTEEILKSGALPLGSITYNTTIHSSGPAIIQAPGAIARDIQQINTHVQSISQENQQIAELLQRLSNSLPGLEAPPEIKVEVADRIKVTAEEIALPATARKPWRIKDQVEGLKRFVEEAAKTYKNLETLKPVVEQLWVRVLEFLATLPPPPM